MHRVEVSNSGALVRWFDEVTMADVGQVGGKCASLGELTRAGIRVPPGFALTTGAYARYRASGAMPDDVRAALAAAYGALSQQCGQDAVPVAVRSSAVDEDSREASFAGQQETYLWRSGVDDVSAHVVRCWESLYAPGAIAYRSALQRQAGGSEPRMSVAIQKMVDADVAGVLFTLSPTTGDRSVVAINAAWGLGVGVVGGKVTPDEYWVDKVTMRIKRQTIVDKPRAHRPNLATFGTRVIDVEPEHRSAPCLSDVEALELAQLGKIVEQHYGRPQDVEWAIQDGVIYVLQSRPETVWSRKSEAALAPSGPTPRSAVDFVLRTMGARPRPSAQTEIDDKPSSTNSRT